MVNNIDFNNLEEKDSLEKYLELFNNQFNGTLKNVFLVEHPIVSVDKKKLSDKQCIPDAILSDGSWIEITTFSRSASMRKMMGDTRRYREKFEGIRPMPEISPYELEPLISQWGKAMEKKIIKDYSQFLLLADLQVSKGILLIVFMQNDPFFDYREYLDFIDYAKYEYIYDNFNFSKNCFQKIMFLAHVYIEGGWQYKLEIILDSKAIDRTSRRSERKRNCNIEVS
ncbi:MAG: hypothetical protein P4L31_02575 [Candidatus Babeliales bacterium]|nr:hypothetical protein [Candidatus Babeliales bacterium]